MPVSTRSRILNGEDDENGVKTERERTQMATQALRSPDDGLEEKFKSLSLLHEKVKRTSIGFKNHIFKSQEHKPPLIPALEEKVPSITAIPAENSIPNSTVAKNYVSTQFVTTNVDQITGFCCPQKAPGSTKVARKLSLDSKMEAKKSQERDSLFEKQSNESSRIMVFVRLRPLMNKEKEAGSQSCVRIVNWRDVYLTEFTSEHDYLGLKRAKGRHFTFDASFPETSRQQEVYSTTTSDLVEAVLQGRNGSVFCYGATGAGKTYTMLGTVENPGVMVLAIKDLFSKVRQRSYDGNHVVQLSYLEVYNETVRDLISPGRPLVLREDKQGIVAAGLSQFRAYSIDEVMALCLQGNKNRTTEPTRMNETSSRSHAILQVVVEYQTRDALMNVVKRVGKLSLIDLAGSERALATDQRTLRSVEGANINRSLLALSSCVNALVEGKKHIPYRNSKLTQLLKDSLGGACNTVMIANISPSNLSFGETQTTLHWADRAKMIRNKAYETNEEVVEDKTSDAEEQAKLLFQVQEENRELRVQLARKQQKLLSFQAQTLAIHSSPTRPSTTSILCPLPSSELQIKALEKEMERMKIDHLVQIKKRDDKIRELSLKIGKYSGGEELKMLVTRPSMRRKENGRDVETERNRFHSKPTIPKKRNFWDITTANSPSLIGRRKTRSRLNNAEPLSLPS